MPLNELRKWSTTVFRAKSANDSAQVPSASVTLNVYRRGATVSSGTSVTGSGGTQTVSVYDIGSIAVDDALQVGTTAGTSLTVTAINSATSITVRNDNVSAVSIAQYARLVITSAPPTLYREVTGTQDYGGTTGQIDVNSSGFVQFYITERYFDWIVSGASITTSLYTDEESGPVPVTIGETYINVALRFPGYAPQGMQVDVAAAIAAATEGNTLWFQPGYPLAYTPPDANGWAVNKSLTFESEIRGFEPIFKPYIPSGGTSWKNSHVFQLTAGSLGGGWRFRHINISGQSTDLLTTPILDGTGTFIRFATDAVLGPLILEDVRCFYPGRNCVQINRTGSSYLVTMNATDCVFYGAPGAAFYAQYLANASFRTCAFIVSRGAAVQLEDVANGSHFTGCDFETCGSSLTDTTHEGIVMVLRSGISFIGCNIEGNNSYNGVSNTVKNGFVLEDCDSAIIEGCEITGDGAVDAHNAGSRGIWLYGSGTTGCRVANNMFVTYDKAVEVDTTCGSGNFIGPQANDPNQLSANGKCQIVLPSGKMNFAFVQNRNGSNQGVTDGVGILFPSFADKTNVNSGVIQDGLVMYDSTAHLFYFRLNGAWKTFTPV